MKSKFSFNITPSISEVFIASNIIKYLQPLRTLISFILISLFSLLLAALLVNNFSIIGIFVIFITTVFFTFISIFAFEVVIILQIVFNSKLFLSNVEIEVNEHSIKSFRDNKEVTNEYSYKSLKLIKFINKYCFIFPKNYRPGYLLLPEENFQQIKEYIIENFQKSRII